METLKAELKRLGWNLSNDGIVLCENEFRNSKSSNSKVSCQEIISCALNFDLAEIGEKVIPDDLGKGKINEFSGPCVLQVMKVRNASAPKANEESSVAPRLLQVHLSDGHKTCIAIEHSNFGKELSINTPPGSKVCLNGTMQFRNGFFLLDSKNIRFLGGQVDSLYNKWKSAKEAGGFFRNVTEGDEAPPPFVPFGKDIVYKCDTSNPSLQGSTSKGDVNGDDKGFSEQRESAIAKVKESMGDTSGKSFATSKNKSESDSSKQSFRKTDDRSNSRNFNDTRNRNDGFKKPGNFRVDESKCDQICQMGFARSEAFGALRRYSNNLDEALESLLSSNDSKQQTSSRYENKGSNGTSRGRGGRRLNRGGRSHQNDQDNPLQTSSATLFDFVETKMASSSHNAKSQKTTGQDKSKKENQEKQSSSSATTQDKPSYHLDDDALQEEYIMEYVKELSLVETRGEVDDAHRLNEGSSQSSDTNPENRGVNKYRGGGNRYSKNNRNEVEFESRNDSRKFQSNRSRQDRTGFNRFSQDSDSRRSDRNPNRNKRDETDQTGFDRFSQNSDSRQNDRNPNRNKRDETDQTGFDRFSQDSDSRRNDRNPNRNKRDETDQTGFDRFSQDSDSRRNDRNPNRNKRDETDQTGFDRFSQDSDSRRNDRNPDRNKRDQADSDRNSNPRNYRNNDTRRYNDDKNKKSFEPNRYDDRNNYDRRTYNDTGTYSSYNDERPPRRDYSSGRRSPQKFYEPPRKEIPPRFRNKKQQESRDFHQPSNEQYNQPKRSLTLGDTNRLLHNEKGFSDQAYPIYASENSQEKTKTSPSHSYQDQRQQNRGGGGRKPQNSPDYRPQNRTEQFYESEIQWKPGMTCQAIYWEDRQYYRAEVMDVHPSKPTAVVQFIGYGNSEEVFFENMRPDKSVAPSPLSDHGSYNGPTTGLEFTRGHKGPTRYPGDREKRVSQKPPRMLYQPPMPQH